MAALNPSQNFHPMDVLPQEGFERVLLDRPFDLVNERYQDAFGEASPLQISTDIVTATGSVALADIGGGTMHTLQGWAQATRVIAHANADQVTGTGVNLYDYSRESASPRTRAAIASGVIRYVVGNAEQLPLQTNSVDVALSNAAIMHSNHPEQWLSEMVRVVKPGGHLFFNTVPPQIQAKSPLLQFLEGLDRTNFNTTLQTLVVPQRHGVSIPIVYGHVQSPHLDERNAGPRH